MSAVLLSLLKEVTLSVVGKVTWKVIFERFYTRLLVHSLEKIKKMNTNEVVDETVDDIIYALKGKRLKVIDEL